MIALSTTSASATHSPIRILRDVLNPWSKRYAVLGTLALTLSLASGAMAQTQSQTPAQPPAQPTAQISPTPVVSGVVIAPPAAPAPAPTPFTPLPQGITDAARGAESIESVGHLRPRDVDSLEGIGADWLKSAVIPLYVSPGGDHWGWIYQGWLVPKGQTYLAIGRDAGFVMVRSYENLYSFPVLEVREDGWVRVQYTSGGSAWAHISQLELGEVPLVVEGWDARLGAQSSVYFLDKSEAQALRSQPELSTSNMLSWVPAESLIEPLKLEGDWMQVRVTRPANDCRALAGATVTEGWMRWRGEEREALAWYKPDSSCAQGG